MQIVHAIWAGACDRERADLNIRVWSQSLWTVGLHSHGGNRASNDSIIDWVDASGPEATSSSLFVKIGR